MKVKYSNCNNYSMEKVRVHVRKGRGCTEGSEEGGTDCLQVPLIKGNLGSPPLSYICTETCFLPVPWALWLSAIMSSRATLDALQDSPHRAIMSTPEYQFMLSKSASTQTWGGHDLSSKPTIAPIHFSSLSRVTVSPQGAMWYPCMCGWRDGPEPRTGINHFTSGARWKTEAAIRTE